jgi:uncharacterized protein involved in tolerance to divalent cations
MVRKAHKIAKLLVKGKKAASVNIVPGVDSLFFSPNDQNDLELRDYDLEFRL